MRKYIIEYWYLDEHEIYDYSHVTVEASGEKEALFKAKYEARRGAKNFTIV